MRRLKKHISWISPIFSLVLVLGLYLGIGEEVLSFGAKFPCEARVAKVIDGDTVLLEQGEMVRYLGINAPETRIRVGGRWKEQPQIFGEEAKRFNQRLVAGKRIRLEYDQKKKDQYGRLLAYVRIGDILVNGELVRQGLSLVDVRSPNLRYQKRFSALQQEARDFNRGIWTKMTQTILDREAFRHIGEIAAIQGRIIHVHVGKKKTYLNFGKNFQKDFTGIIFRDNLKIFNLNDRNPKSLFLKKKVKIFGFVKNMGGPAIIISAPSQIDILP